MGNEVSTLGGAMATIATSFAAGVTFGQVDALNKAVADCSDLTASAASRSFVRHVGETIGTAVGTGTVAVAAGVTLGQVDALNKTFLRLGRHTAASAISSGKAVMQSTNDLVDGIPVVGHLKGGVHYALGDSERGEQAMRSASRTTGVVAGGILGIPGGPVGIIAAGIAGGAIIDGVQNGKAIVPSERTRCEAGKKETQPLMNGYIPKAVNKVTACGAAKAGIEPMVYRRRLRKRLLGVLSEIHSPLIVSNMTTGDGGKLPRLVMVSTNEEKEEQVNKESRNREGRGVVATPEIQSGTTANDEQKSAPRGSLETGSGRVMTGDDRKSTITGKESGFAVPVAAETFGKRANDSDTCSKSGPSHKSAGKSSTRKDSHRNNSHRTNKKRDLRELEGTIIFKRSLETYKNCTANWLKHMLFMTPSLSPFYITHTFYITHSASSHSTEFDHVLRL